MIDKSGKYATKRYYDHSGWVSGNMPVPNYSYGKNYNRPIRLLCLLFALVLVSALLNLDYADILIKAIDWLVSLWRMI